MYRGLDGYINYLLPYIGMKFDNLNVQGMIFAIKTLQNKLEDKMNTFFSEICLNESI